MTISVVSTTKANTLSVTIPATTAHNCIVVCVDSFNTATQSVSGVTIGGSADHFAQAVAAGGGISAPLSAIWVDRDCAGGQTAIAISGSNLAVTSADGGVVVYEIAGLDTASPLDVTHPGTGSGAAWTSGSTPTTAQASEIWVGTAGVAATAAGPGAPWVNTVPTGSFSVSGVDIVSSTGTAAYAGTAASGSWSAAVITLKAAASASVSGTAQPRPTLTAPRRAPARALIRFTPVTTTNAAPSPHVNGTAQPRPTLTAPRRAPARALIRFTPVTTTNTPRQLLVSLASRAGTDDYGNAFPQGIQATAGVIEGPTLVGSDAFFYSPTPGFGNLTESITGTDGTDPYGNAWIAGTATYADNGSFWSAVVVAGGVVTWYKAAGPAGPWAVEAGIGFTFNNITGGGLSLTAPAGISGSFSIPQPSPAATSAAIISALFAAGIFN